MVMILTLAFGLLVVAWWLLGAVADALIERRIHVPVRWAVRIMPGYLPAYVRQDLARARQALARIRTSTPED